MHQLQRDAHGAPQHANGCVPEVSGVASAQDWVGVCWRARLCWLTPPHVSTTRSEDVALDTRQYLRATVSVRYRALAPAPGTVIQWMLKVGALRNGFTYRKLFHQLEEIVSELLRYLWEIPSDAHQSFSCQELRWEMRHFVVSRDVLSNGTTLVR